VRAEPVAVVEDGGAARLLEAAGVSKRAPPRLFVADIEAEAALGGGTALWWAPLWHPRMCAAIVEVDWGLGRPLFHDLGG
jgi:hypothetical protein